MDPQPPKVRPPPPRAYVEELLEGEGEARLVVRGSFGLHVKDRLLEDLFVADVGLDQVLEAGNQRLCLFAELGGNTNTHRRITPKTVCRLTRPYSVKSLDRTFLYLFIQFFFMFS